jgi:hypothetical protein
MANGPLKSLNQARSPGRLNAMENETISRRLFFAIVDFDDERNESLLRTTPSSNVAPPVRLEYTDRTNKLSLRAGSLVPKL